MRAITALVGMASAGLLGGCSAGTLRFSATPAAQGLSPVTSEKADEMGPAISPDGRILLFDTRREREATIVGVDPSSGARRTVYTTGTSNSQEAAWHPEGKYFVYTSNSPGTWSLVRTIANSPNAAVSIVMSGEVTPWLSDPSVSTDGGRVAFATLIRGTWNIAVANIDGSNLTLLGEGRDPAWSPDGRLAFYRITNGRAHIYTVDATSGSDLIQVTTGESDNGHPAWAPDGRYLVFTSNRTAKKAPRGIDREYKLSGRFNLFAVRPDGTGLVQLTDGEGLIIQPAWGRDGWIYFATNQSGNYDIWRLRPTGELVDATPRGTP